jgi:hypothetical protein
MKFYGIQPSEFWRLAPDEVAELGEWMQAYQKEEQEANR